MVLLYLVAGSVLLFLASADEGHSPDTYPNPMLDYDYSRCRREAKSYICDPDGVISKDEADQLNDQLVAIVEQLHCPCSRYSCNRHNQGYKIGIALMKRMRYSEPFDESAAQELDNSEYNKKKQEWLLHEAELFAHNLLKNWDLGHCDEDVIVLYSQDDHVLYTAVGDVARMKLTNHLVHNIELRASPQFGHGGSISMGLLKIVKDYRRVFQDSYVMEPPRIRPVRGHAASVMKYSGSFAIGFTFLLSIFSLMLC